MYDEDTHFSPVYFVCEERRGIIWPRWQPPPCPTITSSADFEATCDELSDTHGTLEVARDTQEIIELPWVVLDVAALKVRESCQIYIKPVHTP